MTEDELIGVADKAAELLGNKNLAAFDVYVRSSSATSVEVRDQKLDSFEEAVTWGVGIRALLSDGRMGFSYSTGSEEAVLASANKAVENAASVEPDEFNTIPAPPETPYPVFAAFDESIRALGGQDKIAMAMQVEKAAREFDPRVTKVRSASASFSESQWAILTSTGIRLTSSGTYFNGGVMAVAEADGESQMGYDFGHGRSLGVMDYALIGRRAAEQAVSILGAKKPPSGMYNVMLENTIAADFLGVLAQSFSAEAVFKGRSLLAGRVGQKICSESINIIDDGLLAGGLSSRAFDDEGMPSRRTVLIQGGVLNCFLNSMYTAKKTGGTPTGSAARGGFRSQPGVSPTNLFIEPGNHSKDELISGLSKGLLVQEVLGMHTANAISGDFSVGVSGQWIENGKIVHPVREAAISGNILAMFTDVEALGSDIRFTGRLGAPSILLKPISVSGS